jgi:NAD(P)-dependent dehydrogenase (short-subunit alcohol dehydrogenase family)
MDLESSGGGAGDRPPALVTGGARRIGAAIVEALAEAGHPVAIHCGRSRPEAEALARRIVERGGRAGVVEADLRDLDSLDGLVERAAAAVGPIRLLVNSAAIFAEDRAGALAAEGLAAHISVNLAAPCLMASAVARRLPEGTRGLVVNIVDQRVLKPTPQFFSYALSKAGLWWATRTMAQEFAPRLRVVAIAPGPTVASERQQEDDFRRQSEAVLLGRGPDLAEFGRTIRWLLDTPSVTGQLIALDGGQHLAWQTPDVVGIPE